MNGLADHYKPIRDKNTSSRDESVHSIFPSVNGREGDLILFSMAFDDKAEDTDFRPPNGTDLVNFVNGRDEAGFLYSKELTTNNATGELVTRGPGGPENKDVLISLVLKSSSSSNIDSSISSISNRNSSISSIEDERFRIGLAH